MKFEVSRDPSTKLWGWYLSTNDSLIARSPISFATEEAARSQIAKAKTAMKGARFAKVETIDLT